MFSIKSLFKICILTTFSLFNTQGSGLCSTNDQFDNRTVRYIPISSVPSDSQIVTYSVPDFSFEDFCDNFCGRIKQIQLSEHDLAKIRQTGMEGEKTGRIPDNITKHRKHKIQCKQLFKQVAVKGIPLYQDAMKKWNEDEVQNCIYKNPFLQKAFDKNPLGNDEIAEITDVNTGRITYIDLALLNVELYHGTFEITYENTKDFLISYFGLKHYEFRYQLASHRKYNGLNEFERESICENVYEFSGDAGDDSIYLYLRAALDYADYPNPDHKKDRFRINTFSAKVRKEIDDIIDNF